VHGKRGYAASPGIGWSNVAPIIVMPAVTSTGTNAPTTMIDEKGAVMIKGAMRQRLAAWAD